MPEKKPQTDPPAGAPKQPGKTGGDWFAELFSAHNMGMTEDQLKRFRIASDHPYTCKCEACLEWWTLVGPEQWNGEGREHDLADETRRALEGK